MLGSWGMEWSWIKSLLLLMSSSLGFFNKFSKQTLLGSSFDSLRLLNVYMSLPRHLTCLFSILILVMAIYGAQGRVWRIKAYLYHIYCKVKNGTQREEQLIQSVYGLWWMRWKLLLYDLSLYKFFWEYGYLFFFSFFSWTFMCPHFFLFLFVFMDLHVSIYFFSR